MTTTTRTVWPELSVWLADGPAAISAEAALESERSLGEDEQFYLAVAAAMEDAREMMRRFARVAEETAEADDDLELVEVATALRLLAERPARSAFETAQATWVHAILAA